MMNVIALVIDRLHAGFLGCYGNAWVATPHFNRLAAEGFLFDQAFVDQPDLNQLCRSWWTGTHTLERHGETAPLAELFNRAGFATACLTDEPAVAGHPLKAAFDEIIAFEAAVDRPGQLAESADETQLARFFAAGAQWLEDAREPFLLWMHSRGMGAAWDAPYSFREQYGDEEDAPPPLVVEPPNRCLTAEDDPDELWGLCQAYAGQATLADDCLGGLLELLDAGELGKETLLVVLGARGFPLGRNGALGAVNPSLYGELVQTPWLMRFPDGVGAAARSQCLVQSCDLAPTLLQFAGIAHDERLAAGRSLLPVVRDEVFSVRDHICLLNEAGERALRTPAWYLRLPAQPPGADPPAPALYGKPDDRWEVNDVADRCPEVVAAMRAAHDELAASLASGREPPALDESLVR